MRTKLLSQELADAHDLDDVQRRYLESLSAEVEHLSAPEQSTFLEDAAEMLGERPHQDWDTLTEALSHPKEFAATWLADHHVPSEPKRQNSLRNRLRQPRTLVLVALAVALLTASSWTYIYFTATPEFGSACGGARGPSVEQLDAAGETEYVMPLEIDSRYGSYVCIQAFDDRDSDNPAQITNVTLHRIYLDVPPLLAFQPVGWEIISNGNETGDASNHRRTPIVTENGVLQAIVWFEGDRCNTSGGTGFSELYIDYTYRGRQHTGSVDLGASYTVWAEDFCTPEVRAAEDARDDAWAAVVGAHFYPRTVGTGPLDEQGRFALGSVDLAPVAVSRDLCRYLRGVNPPEHAIDFEIEPLSERAVFRAEPEDATVLIDGAVLGICPEFAGQRDSLIQLIDSPTESVG